MAKSSYQPIGRAEDDGDKEGEPQKAAGAESDDEKLVSNSCLFPLLRPITR